MKYLRRQARARLLAPALRALTFLCAALPWSLVQSLGRAFGTLVALVARRDRARAREHLSLAFPELEEAEIRRLAQAMFRHLGCSALELLHLFGRTPGAAGEHVEIVGFENVAGQRRHLRPIVILTGHCGNWELISSANASHGLGLAAMAREIPDADLQDFTVALRRHFGSETIARGSAESARQLRRVLKTGGALGLLIDQDIATDGVFVPFFGRPANTTKAAAELALRLKAAVVPTFSERLEDGRHRVTFHPPLELPDDVQEATALMTAKIEEQIRRRPEQWVWMHKRWRRRPPAD